MNFKAWQENRSARFVSNPKKQVPSDLLDRSVPFIFPPVKAQLGFWTEEAKQKRPYTCSWGIKEGV